MTAKPTMTFRRATLADAQLLFSWRNDPLTRANSIRSDEVTFDSHVAWLTKALSNPGLELYIARSGDQNVGTMRLELAEGTRILSWTIAPEARGKGHGKEMLHAFLRQVRSPCTAYIKRDNVASERMASAAGMRMTKETEELTYWSYDPLNRE